MRLRDIFSRRVDAAPEPAPVRAMLPHAEGRLDGFENAITGLGTFNGASNFDTFVARCRHRGQQEANAIYCFSGIMARVITLEPKTCFANGFTIEGLKEQDAKALTSYLDGLDAFSKMSKAAMLARQYGGAIVYMAIEDGLDPKEPVNTKMIQRVSNLIVFSCYEATVQKYGDKLDPQYHGEPLEYQISSLGETFTAHASRVLHFDAFEISRDIRISSMGQPGFSPSIIDRIWDSFSSYGSTNEYFRETIKKLTQGVLKLKGVTDSQSTAAKSTILNRFRLLMQQMSTIGDVVLNSDGEDYSTTSRNVTGFAEASNIFVDWLVAESDIPRSMLMLQTAGGLSDGNNGGDHKYWSKHCSSVQESQFTPLAKMLLRYVLASKNAPVNDVPTPFTVEWPPIDNLTESEEATIYAQRATGRAADVASGVISPTEARRSPDVVQAYSLDDESSASKAYYTEDDLGS